MILRLLRLVFTFLLSLIVVHSIAQDTVVYSDAGSNLQVGASIGILEDPGHSLTIGQVLRDGKFENKKQDVPNMQISASAFWCRLLVRNNTQCALVMNVAYPTLDSLDIYTVDNMGGYTAVHTGEFTPYFKREYKHQNFLFDLNIPPGQTRELILKVSAQEQLQLPVFIGTSKTIDESLYNGDLIFGIYAGIILVMFFYNLFIFFTTRDRSYLLYVVYIFFVGFTQACVQGYSFRFFYPSSPSLANLMLVLAPSILGLGALEFLKNFMHVKQYTPAWYKVIWVFEGLYAVIITAGFLGYYRFCAQAVQINAGVASMCVVVIGTQISRKGYRPAKFFLVAWSIFLFSVIVFVMRNFNLLPYNVFTYYALQAGSALEVVLLSFALADKINILRKEKEESQAQTLEAVRENERIVREQNIILERKVNERTYELKLSNEELNVALKNLKDAQTQLVESEKMASLGQLTAGIAHEINNPINFVTSNVKPLNRDVRILIDAVSEMERIALAGDSTADKQRVIEDYKLDIDYDYLKEEIDQLLSGIGEGASRTAEIVKGLRIFSRLDEDDLKKADINEGLESTLVITNNMLNNIIKVKKSYSNLPLVECYPGKLNQVFLNIISNAIYAVKKKFGEIEGGELSITTSFDEQYVYVNIADNGTGMDENTKKRLFEPFFTTKDVGEGTGLGMSIAFNTISKHNGTISVHSEVGKGTEFILKLPQIQK